MQGFEIGSGFSGAAMLGSEHNDEFYMEDGRVRTRTNRSGGVQGGISNGAAPPRSTPLHSSLLLSSLTQIIKFMVAC